MHHYAAVCLLHYCNVLDFVAPAAAAMQPITGCHSALVLLAHLPMQSASALSDTLANTLADMRSSATSSCGPIVSQGSCHASMLESNSSPLAHLTAPTLSGGPESCKASDFTIASTAPGQQAALSSPNEAFVLTLSPAGRLILTERATGRTLLTSSTRGNCRPPFSLVLLPNGLLVLKDKLGSVLWSGGSACAGNTTCYSYALQNDGQLVVRDASNALVWSSTSASADAAANRLRQIISDGRQEVSCIHSGPLPTSSYLTSSALTYRLVLQQQGAQLQLQESVSGAVQWVPPGALPGQAPAKLCIAKNGSLQLTAPGAQQLWSSSRTGPATAGPYVAFVTDDGCLEVMDGVCRQVWSNHDSSSKDSTRRLGGRRQLNPPPAGRRPRPQSAARSESGGVPTQTPTATSSMAARDSSRLPPAQLWQVPMVAARPTSVQAARALQPKPVHPAPRTAQTAVWLPVGGGIAAAGGSVQGAKGAAPSQPACSLLEGQPCGGLMTCGRNGECPHIGCCVAQTACMRRSDYVWLCAP